MASTGDAYHSLIQRALTGDREAFDELVRDHHSRIRAVLRKWRGSVSDQDIADVLGEAFLRAFGAMAGFDPRAHRDPDAFFRWLSGIALNVARENAKREVRRRCEPIEREPAESGVTQSRAMRRDERMERLQSALDSLPPDYREVVRLVRLEGRLAHLPHSFHR